ncbi:hypothetical protein IWW36_003501, partial [Coemansia brasiliensis]
MGTPHTAGTGYDPQLELELEQQQQQFQQQYLQQYRQMQQQQQPWVDDAFAGQGIGGFQNTPHNPNLPQTLGMPAYLHTPPHIAPATRAPNRRPWVRNHAQPKPMAAPHVSEIQPPSSSSEDESSSSDESAYGINSDEEVPIAAANSAPAPVSRREQARPANGDSSAEESDDDVPLSIISSSSAQNNATVRRTKTVAPAALSPRSQVFKSLSMRSRPCARHDQHAAMSEAESDEDAPLDKLKAELASGARPTPSINGSSRAASLSSVRRTNTASTSTHNAIVDVEQTKPNSATSIQSASESDVEQPSAEPQLSASVKSLSPQPTPHPSPALSSHHSTVSEANSCKPSKPSPCTGKVPEYLPSGNALPGLPVKRRSIKPRAAVQYIALADIIESTEQAQNQHENESDDRQQAIDDASASDHDARSIQSFTSVSSRGDKLMETLRTGPVELLTASTEHSGSKAAVDRVIPEDYGDIDQLLEDLDGIMNGSLAARRRFSLTLMRHSLAVSHGLVEPADFSESLEGDHLSNIGTTADNIDTDYQPIEEFKPLEISTGADQTDIGNGLDLGDLLTTLSLTNHGNNDDDDVQPLDKLAAKRMPATESDSQAPMLAVASPLVQPPEAPPEPPTQPVELTRSQKIQKALEKLDLMNVRKVSIRIYVQDARRYYTFSLTEFTTSEMIIKDMKKSNIIDADKDNWALFELVDYFGIERPLNHYENLMSVVESWEPRSNNYIIAKGFSQQPALTLLGGVHSGEHAVQGMLYYRVKKSKWQKGVFRLQGHNMLFLKDSRGKAKKDSHYLTLTNNDVYTPFQPLRGAPTRFVFGLKSEMPMQMFEKPDEDYVKWFAVQTLDGLRQWLQILRFSKNQI